MRAKLPHTTGKVDRDGTSIHYEIYGDGDRAMLFIPPWSIVHSRVYKAQVPYFSDRFRVIVYDPRGNGESGRPDAAEDYDLQSAVGDALAVLDAAGAESAIVFAYSYGALVASVVAAHHPDRVDALVAIGASAPLVQSYLARTPGAFEARHESHKGWQKFNRHYWRQDYPDFCKFFMEQIYIEPHSTKQIDDGVEFAAPGDGEMLAMTQDKRDSGLVVDEAMYRRISCPVLLIHGGADRITPPAMSEKIAELTGGELHILPGVGHGPHARFPAWTNTTVRDFLARRLGTWRPRKARPSKRPKALYLSSPIGLGHARRDLAITRALRELSPELEVDWLAQDPVTRLLDAEGERLHPASLLMASESAHIEEEAGEHDLHAFHAIRNMDEILIRNFMIFQEAVEEGNYDLVIADEAWDIDHYWHEHPEMKRTRMAWLTDFVGWVPMPAGGEREAFLTGDYNAEMIGHVERTPGLRDRAIFVGNPDDIVPMGFGDGLPAMRDWVPRHFDFSGYVIGQHPSAFGEREELRARFGYRDGEKVCIVAVGGSGVGGHLIRRMLEAFPIARRLVPELRMIVVTGPRLDPAALRLPAGAEARGFVPDLDRHLACCDLAVVQGGLTTCMELAAAATPFLYFPLRNHFEQNFHVAHRLERYGAGRRMIFGDNDAETIAWAMVEELRHPRRPLPVEADGAARAAKMLAELL